MELDLNPNLVMLCAFRLLYLYLFSIKWKYHLPPHRAVLKIKWGNKCEAQQILPCRFHTTYLLSSILKFIQNMIIVHTPIVSYIFNSKVMLAIFLKHEGKTSFWFVMVKQKRESLLHSFSIVQKVLVKTNWSFCGNSYKAWLTVVLLAGH